MRKQKTKVWNWGPFRFYSGSRGFLDISLRGFENESWGWEWSYRDPALCEEEKPVVQIRLGKLMVLYFEKWKEGFEVWFMGFWWMG